MRASFCCNDFTAAEELPDQRSGRLARRRLPEQPGRPGAQVRLARPEPRCPCLRRLEPVRHRQPEALPRRPGQLAQIRPYPHHRQPAACLAHRQHRYQQVRLAQL